MLSKFVIIVIVISCSTPFHSIFSSKEETISNSVFELVQTPSDTEISLGETITVELRIPPISFNKIKEILLFGCLTGSNNSCSLDPINMEKIEESSSFKYSWKPKNTDTLIKYRFITFFTNGSTFSFPSSLDYENYPNLIKNESDYYYFTVKMILNQSTLANIYPFIFLVFIIVIPAVGMIIIGLEAFKYKRNK